MARKAKPRYEKKSWRDAEDEGVTGLHYAYRMGDTYFPPSQFAIAWIAVQDASGLRKSLDALVERDGLDTPMLAGLIEDAKSVRAEHPRRSLSNIIMDQLKGMARQGYGLDKMIAKSMVQDVSAKSEATMSPYEQVSVRIDTREKRSKKDKAVYDVSLHHPIVRGIPPLFFAEGGTLHERKRRGLNHWTSDDVIFMDDMRRSVVRDSGGMVSEKDVSWEFYKPIQIVGYAYASALLAFEKFVKEKRIRLKPDEQVLMPFDFGRHPEYAFEAFLMANNFRREPNQSAFVKRMFTIDNYLSGKAIGTKQFVDWYRKGIVTKEVVKYSRSFEDYSWAIIQALEKHFYLKERKDKDRRMFVGYALEFAGTPYMTVSMVFRNRSDDPKVAKDDFDVRIIYDSSLRLPYLMYKSMIPNSSKIITPGLRENPLSKVNYAKGVSRGFHEIRDWNEIDQMTGRKVHVTIWEPERKYLKHAEELSRERGPGVRDLKGRYIENLSEFYHK